MVNAWFDNLSILAMQIINEFSLYLPRILAALAILLIGAALARMIKRLAISVLEALKVSKIVEKTPIEHFMKNADLTSKIEVVIGSLLYWLVMLVVLQTAAAVLGLAPLTLMLDRIISYVPNVISAVLILFFGVLVAGVVESLVKGAIRSIDGSSSRIFGKVASYLVVTIAVLAAISELGIARDFIMILFIGFMAMISLGFGLALGLGGKDLVAKLLDRWYQRTVREINP